MRIMRRYRGNPITDAQIVLRGNKKWCEEYGEDIRLPRFIGDVPLGKDKQGYLIFASNYKDVSKYVIEKITEKPFRKKQFKKGNFKKWSKSHRSAWWRNLTAKEQADWLYSKLQLTNPTITYDSVKQDILARKQYKVLDF